MGPDHAEAFLTDLVDGSGRLNEIKLALRSEGVIKNMGKMDIAANLMLAGKMNPLHIFGEEDIEGHDDLVKMINAARKAASKEELCKTNSLFSQDAYSLKQLKRLRCRLKLSLQYLAGSFTR